MRINTRTLSIPEKRAALALVPSMYTLKPKPLRLRITAKISASSAKAGARVHYPELRLCSDNGAMIALAAAMRVQAGCVQPQRDLAFSVMPRWALDAA